MAQTFGDLLKYLRKRMGMTQDDLAAAIGYSRSLVAAVERNHRLPNLQNVIETYLPALGLQEDLHLATQLVELAALARGERPPSSLTFPQERQVTSKAKETEDRHSLPLPPTELLGRQQAVSHLCNRLLGHHGRLLTLVGPPGVGKTRLAQAIAISLQRIYRDGVIFVPLAAITDPSLIATSLLTALKLQHNAAEPPQSRLIEHLRRKELLLVLDNFEQLLSTPLYESAERVASVSLIATLLTECAELRLLVTSRERLHLRAEQRYRVPPLTMAAAIELFTQRATAVDPNFVLTVENRPTVEAICQRLDCLPLAIELCAAQLDLLALPQLLTHLQSSSLDLLVGGAHDLPPQQRALRSAILHSYQLLNEWERVLFRSLGVFAGGFDLASLEVVSAWSQEQRAPSLLATLQSLIGKSLVHTETLSTGEQRFLLLEMIREFALEQARAKSEEAALRQRHYAAYLQLFRTGDSHLRGAEATTWFTRLAAEQDNLRTALQWAINETLYADMAWLLLAANWFWNHHGQHLEACRWLAPLLPHHQALAVELRLAILIIFHAHAKVPQGTHAVEYYHAEMKSLLATSPHPLLQVAAWVWIGIYAADFSKTMDAYERAISLARTASESATLSSKFGLLADRDFMLGVTLQGFGSLLSEQGAIARATALATEGFQFLQARGNRYERADGIGTLGHLAWLRGDLEEACALLQEAVQISMAVRSEEMLSNWQPLLGLVMLFSNDATSAHQLLDEGWRLCLAMQNKYCLARACIYLAESALWEGRMDEAQQWLRQSLGYHADPRRITIYEVQQIFIAARLATAQQQYHRAATLFGLAEQVHSQIHHCIGGPMRALADAALATVQAALEPAFFAAAFTAGQQMTLEEAFTTRLTVTSAPDAYAAF